MTERNSKGGFTLLEMLVASLLLTMMVVALSMVFSSSASAWRIGRAGVDGLHDMRHRLSEFQLASDNALPSLRGKGSGVGYVRPVWINGTSLIDSDGDAVSNGRGFDTKDVYGGAQGVETSGTKPFKGRISAGNVNAKGFRNYIIGVGSRGPDGEWNTKDDIATWPNERGGGI